MFGSLLFILYSNQFPIDLQNCHSILFADDTTIYTTGTYLMDTFKRINTDLDVMSTGLVLINCWLIHQKINILYILKRGDYKFKT